MRLTETQKSYMAGFLDGDGCVMFQLIRKKDYTFGFQIRASIVFYQKSNNKSFLEWLKTKLKYGYIRDRKDGMTEYTIVGIPLVIETLKMLKPYLRLKKRHVSLALKIAKLLPRYTRLDDKLLLKVSTLVDQFGTINYSKKRRNTTKELKAFLKSFPRND